VETPEEDDDLSFLRRLFERRRGHAAPAYERVGPSNRLKLKPSTGVLPGEYPPIEFGLLLEIYLKDPTARAAVDYLADQVVGMGFYTTAELPEAKELVDEFCERVGLDELLQITAREVIAFGNSFWLKITPDKLKDLKLIPITNIHRIFRAPNGTVEAYEVRSGSKHVRLKPEEVIHFKWNAVNNEAFGSGLLRTLAEPLELQAAGVSERRPVFVMKALMQEALIMQLLTHSSPNQLWIFPGIPPSELDPSRPGTIAYEVANMPPWGARWVSNQPDANVKVAVPRISRGFEMHIENISDEFVLGLQTPLPKLIIKRGFTEASAKAAVELVERKVMALQRFIKRVIERQVFTPLVEQAGFDPREARVRLHWGVPERPDLRVSDILRAFELGVISREEARSMLAEIGWRLSTKEAEKT